MKSNFQKRYHEVIAPELKKKFNYGSIMQVPRLTHITINMGVSEAVADKKIITHAVEYMTKIAGQKPVVTKARISVSAFKIRQGWPIGCKVTLRRERMYDFLERLISIAIPRIRDFRGYSAKAFDGAGNYNLGIREQIVFPEIDYDKIDALRGMDIAIATTAKNNAEARALLAAFDFPFKE
jgi:large subunit ribosomal protein L5